jgi:ubiquitin-conjugating enzyme E2 Q
MELTYERGREINLRAGDWVALGDEKPAANSTLRHFRVLDVFGPIVRLIMASDERPDGTRLSQTLEQADVKEVKNPKDAKGAKDSVNSMVIVHKYDCNFDDLTAVWKRAVIVEQLKLLPSISEMAEYLTLHKMNSVSMWSNRISPAGVGIFRWIIASNRACIMQIDKSSEEMGDVRINGMGGWMQYRFAMGAPVGS